MTTSISNIDLKNDFTKIHEIYDVVLTKYTSTISAIDKSTDRLHLGTCLILLKSLYNHLTSLNLLFERCYIESSGAVATSLWEKSITLQYLLLDLNTRIPIYSTHETFKKSPWTIKTMVTDIVNNERLPADKKMEDSIDMLYLQYSYLCAIKHGNPYTVTYLNRVQSGKSFFDPTPHIAIEDKDIIGLLYLYSVTTVFDAILDFSKVFCSIEVHERLKLIDKRITSVVTKLDLKVPKIITASIKDFRPEFWDVLEDLSNKHSI